MLLRFVLQFITKGMRSRVQLGETTEITMRVLPIDLDFLMHVNNGVYFSFLDFGRMDMIFRNGLYQAARAKGWYGVVAGESIKFKRSLKLWDKFTIETTSKGHDDKYFFIQQRILCKGELMASAMVKIRFLKKAGGTVSTKEVYELLKLQPENRTDELSQEWHLIETKYLA